MSRLTETIFYVGDFNVDLLDPDKPPKDGRSLLDLLEIFGFDCLITKATRKTKTSETLLDLILTSNGEKTLISDVVDRQTLQLYGQQLQDRVLVKFVYKVSKTSTKINLFKIYKWHHLSQWSMYLTK